MGPENQYEAREYFGCECDNTITAIFEVWEYPMGAHNYDSVEIEGGKLIECFDFTINFHDEPMSDICEKCGDEFFDERKIGICDNCDNEYNEK